MSTMLGFEFFGTPVFSPDQPPITNINYLNITDAIYDEVHVRQDTDSSVDTTGTKQSWMPDTLMDAKFQGDLEAGNVNNAGVQIQSFSIKRRIAGEVTGIEVGSVPFQSGVTVTFTDATAPVGDFIYQLVPVGVNGLEGKPNEIPVLSDFYGWWIVDKDTMKTFQMDMTISNDPSNMTINGSVPIALNQGRIQIDTLSKYPQVYYSDQQYHTFTLSALVIPSVDYTWTDWNNIVNLITQKKPLIVKSGSGDIYVCDVYAPTKSSLLNAYKGMDYMSVQVNAMEVQDYDDFMSS